MIVVSANAATGEVLMFSFPRDSVGFPLYVGGTMPGYWKLNTFTGYTKQHPETFDESGLPALAYEIGYLLGIPIDYYASINICGFPQLIDEVGGVDVCNTKLIQDSGYHWPDGHLGFTLEPGHYHMDGDTALAYARSRHGSSDFARARRQQGRAHQVQRDGTHDGGVDVAHAALTALHGVGPWTADIYLLFCLGHADAFPSGDLAVQESARLALGLRKRPNAKALAKIAETWRPRRGVAAHLLWAYYHVVKKRDVVPVQPNGRPNEAAGKKTPKRKRKNG